MMETRLTSKLAIWARSEDLNKGCGRDAGEKRIDSIEKTDLVTKWGEGVNNSVANERVN